MLLNKAPEQDKGIIMTVPGFMAHDLTMAPIRRNFQLSGFKTVESNVGINLGSLGNLQKLDDTVERTFEENDGQGIILTGHSLGGMLSFFMAYRHPDKIEQVHTLGSPVGAAFGLGGANKALHYLHHTINFSDEHIVGELKERMEDGPPNAVVTSFYSHQDGIVAAKAAQHPWEEGGRHANILIEGSHCGMIVNHKTFDTQLRRIEDVRKQYVLESGSENKREYAL